MNNDLYFQERGFIDEKAWEKERQDRCDKELFDIRNDINNEKIMNDPDERRALFVRIRCKFQNWVDWVRISQDLKLDLKSTPTLMQGD